MTDKWLTIYQIADYLQVSKEKVQDIQRDYCREKYLEDTHCFQVMPAIQCETEIEKNCR